MCDTLFFNGDDTDRKRPLNEAKDDHDVVQFPIKSAASSRMTEFLLTDQTTASGKEAEVKSLYLQGLSHSAVSMFLPYTFRSKRICLSPIYFSLENAEFGHFTLAFCRGRKRSVHEIITHVHSHFAPHSTFCPVTFRLPLPSWFSCIPLFQ